MKKILVLLISLMTFCGAISAAESEPVLSVGAGAFDFKCKGAFDGITMRVDYYVPADGDISNMPIQFVMSGIDRNSDVYRDAWIGRADQYKVIVLAPHFSAEDFPSSLYQLGNVKAAYQQSDCSLMTYTIIDDIFLYVKELVNSSQTQYNLYGHSAGAQFVHRFVLFYHSPLLNKAVAANAGTYTFPTDEAKYQFGYSSIGGMAQWDVTQALAKKLTLFIGENDTERDNNLNVTTEADEQGLTRKERGANFYLQWANTARLLGMRYVWKIKQIEGVSHSNNRMSPVAADFLYDGTSQDNEPGIIPPGSTDILNGDLDLDGKISVIDLVLMNQVISGKFKPQQVDGYYPLTMSELVEDAALFGDLDHNGEFTSVDIEQLVQVMLGTKQAERVIKHHIK